MRWWVCRLQLLLTLASAVILGSESRGTHDHILLSQIRDSPNLEGQDPVFTGWPTTKTNRLMLLREITAVSCENRMKHKHSVGRRWSLMLKQLVYIVTTGLYRVNIMRLRNRPPTSCPWHTIAECLRAPSLLRCWAAWRDSSPLLHCRLHLECSESAFTSIIATPACFNCVLICVLNSKAKNIYVWGKICHALTCRRRYIDWGPIDIIRLESLDRWQWFVKTHGS
jgi:hypothetical protein